MKRIFFLTSILVLFSALVYSQKTVLIKVSFFDYCHDSKNIYFAKLKVNDTLEFRQYITSNYFEFNVPKFLLKSGSVITVNAERLTDNQIEGTIGLPFISSCGCKHETKSIPVDSLLNLKEYSFNLEIAMQKSGCGSLPKFSFRLNSTDLTEAIIDFGSPADSLMLLQENWLVYRLAELIRRDQSLLLVGNADKSELNPSELALQRAEKIKAHLVQFGVDPEVLKIESNVLESADSYSKRKFTKQELLESKMKNANVHFSAR